MFEEAVFSDAREVLIQAALPFDGALQPQRPSVARLQNGQQREPRFLSEHLGLSVAYSEDSVAKLKKHVTRRSAGRFYASAFSRFCIHMRNRFIFLGKDPYTEKNENIHKRLDMFAPRATIILIIFASIVFPGFVIYEGGISSNMKFLFLTVALPCLITASVAVITFSLHCMRFQLRSEKELQYILLDEAAYLGNRDRLFWVESTLEEYIAAGGIIPYAISEFIEHIHKRTANVQFTVEHTIPEKRRWLNYLLAYWRSYAILYASFGTERAAIAIWDSHSMLVDNLSDMEKRGTIKLPSINMPATS